MGSLIIAWHLVLALAAVVIVGRLLGMAFRRIGQPAVMGEIVGGILIGPSLLGWLAPQAYTYLLPLAVAPYLALVAQLGVVLYMFLVGLELDPTLLRRRAPVAAATSFSSIIVPFAMGLALALYLYPRFSPGTVPFASFALFLGLAMSITAFPVLARILTDRGMTRTELGALALTCAAVNDVTAWCLLAFVSGAASRKVGGAWLAAILTLGFAAAIFWVVRPMAARAARRSLDGGSMHGAVALALLGAFIAAWTTQAIGIHAIFGAFLFGAILPHESKLAWELKRRMEGVVTIVLLPAFFVFTGMRTQIGLVSGWRDWLVCALIIAAATAGKFGGTLVAGRAMGLAWRQAAGLGVLMNTRGLMELIVLNVGLELGVISPKLFTMLVLMALATTFATTPILQRLKPI